MGHDLLVGAAWSCCRTAPGEVGGPDELDGREREWMAASVPGTAAGALARRPGGHHDGDVEMDGWDWWFRCRVPAGGDGRWTLTFEGLATVADVWFGGHHVLHSENMFVPRHVDLPAVDGGDDLVVRFAALAPLLARRRPRPRWKSQMVDHQGLRWFRTTVLGRQPGWAVTPAPVGPWRPVRLEPAGPGRVVERRLAARCGDGDTGVVSVTVRLAGVVEVPGSARVRVRRVDDGAGPGAGDGVEGDLTVRVDEGDVVVEGEVVVAAAERWWPHSHGPQPLYGVTVEVGDETVDAGRVGFRTVAVDRSDGGFTVVVNGLPVFCRGACWWPVDPVGLYASDDELKATVELVVEGRMNMVRIPGGTVYEDDRFWDLCDERGIMVWQDCMLGYTDPPEDEAFVADVVAELEDVFGRLGGRPALAVVCGGQEIEEQAALFGLPRERWRCGLTEETIPALADRLLPGVPYVSSSPTGGDLPFQPDRGDCHYWGVGSNLRSPEDARRSGIRFMSEGMAFAVPPERQTVEEACGGVMGAGHDPRWKRAVHHDTGRSWDLEDVRDFYVRELLGVDPQLVRYLDAERALDLGRAVVAELLAGAFGEWRRAGSPCAGGLVVALRDLVPGAGWGIVDALGRPKAPWFSLRRVLAPVAVLVSDEGLNGLHVHVVNDTASDIAGTVTVELFARGELRLEEASRAVEVPARGQVTLEMGSLFDGFRDLSYAYRYGPPPYDVIAVGLVDGQGGVVSELVHLPSGLERPLESDVGLAATARAGEDGAFTLAVTTRRLAQWVVVEVPGFRPSDSWFHLPPGATRTLTLHRTGTGDGAGGSTDGTDGSGGGPPAGVVRALNAQTTARIVVA